METLSEPISPELVLVDPELRPRALRELRRQPVQAPWDAPRWSRPAAVDSPAPPECSAPAGSALTDQGDESAKRAPAIVRALAWWLSVVLHSTAVVALVLGVTVVLRLL